MDARKEQKILSPGWELIWLENLWTKKWEKLRIPHEEAERRRRRERGMTGKTIVLGRKRLSSGVRK